MCTRLRRAYDVSHDTRAWNLCCAASTARERTRLFTDQQQEETETPVESSNPVKGDDPWPTSRTRPQHADSSRTNQNGSAPAFSAGWRTRFMCRASARLSARSHAIFETASSPTKRSARSSAAFSRRADARNQPTGDLEK